MPALSRNHLLSFYKGRLLLPLFVLVLLGGDHAHGRGRGIDGHERASSQVGVASWYGKAHHGKVAASGEKYDMNRLTAAHRTLPFGTLVRVKNLENQRTVEVEITDRGPYARGRIIDLSLAAARELRMQKTGVAWVRVEVVSIGDL